MSAVEETSAASGGRHHGTGPVGRPGASPSSSCWPVRASPASPRSRPSWGFTSPRRSGCWRPWRPTASSSRSNDRGRYRLGVGNLRLAGATTARLDVVSEARPLTRQLAADTGETVNITVRSEESALYLDQVAGSSALQSHNWVGQRIPLHATSNGKVLLSELSQRDFDEALPHLPRYTEHTITSRERMQEELAGVRRLGYALAVDELEVGLTAAAAPIRSAHGDIIASMSISGPTFRLTRQRLEETVPMVVAAAARGLAPPRVGPAHLSSAPDPADARSNPDKRRRQ